MSNEKYLEEIKQAILDYDPEKATEIAKEAMSKGVEPLKALEAASDGIKT
jgi:methanogenic corrinoid protein MtbC1